MRLRPLVSMLSSLSLASRAQRPCGHATLAPLCAPIDAVAPPLSRSIVQPWGLAARRSIAAARHALAATRVERSNVIARAVSTSMPLPPGIKLPTHCSGCGVRLQKEDPDSPGFFQVPAKLMEMLEAQQQQQQQQQQQEGPEQQGQQQAVDVAELTRRRFDQQAELDARREGEPAFSFDAMEAAAGAGAGEGLPDVLCARCYSLKHYGCIKSEAAEQQLPEFDLGRKVGTKIRLQKDRRALVLCVVDVWDFDGSLPRAALKSLLPPGYDINSVAPQDLGFKLMVAVNKFDLLPKEATATRVEQWVRIRMRQAGLPKPEKVFMVSAANSFGVKEMLEELRKALGFRADLWVVGAQNAGKSSLITAMKRIGGSAGKGDPTIAPMPGTTLGLLKVSGIPLGPKHRAFDTPGVPHAYQMTSLLAPAEVRMLLPSRRLKARTYRVPVGSCILVGGVARVDLVEAPGSSIYLTLFLSDDIMTHMGQVEGAEERLAKHGGDKLQPPLSAERLQQLPAWVPRNLAVEGNSWKQSSMDVAIAGLGWIGVGVAGKAKLRVWTYEQVAITAHAALIPDFARDFQRPGFSNILPQASKGGKAPAAGAKKR